MSDKSKHGPIIDELIGLAFDYLSIEDQEFKRPILTGDLYFVLPSVKKAISLYDAIEEDINSKRLLSATILSRTLIEVVVTMLYVVNIIKDESFYDKFLQHGRLRLHRPGKGWEKVTITNQIAWVGENYRITKLQEVYDNCSKLVHFSDAGVQLILDRRDGFEASNVKIVISPNESQFDYKNFKAIHDTSYGLLVILREQMKAQIKGKRLRVGVIKNVSPG